ncbi:MAG: thioredoxin domain-containing protein [Gammaproteobacteria bacterium]
MSDHSHTNNLFHETSPYLLQHAHNPVDWHAWNDSALALAREQNKPILLSIGYSACHWCHVMAHESFEDPDTAALMNSSFVNIKVDREERPDLDRVYQLAHQILAQRGGGWPLTVFLTPDDLTPFFAGTYFPLVPRYGMPSFKEVLTRVSAFYRDHQEQLRQQNTTLQQIFLRMQDENTGPANTLDSTPIETAQHTLAQSFDAHFGGFGRAPKFPHTPALEFLLRRTGDAALDTESRNQARSMLTTTLVGMARGGIHDQLGGGFSRYSVDAEWNIPHFEKMLYDNGPLLTLYAQAWALTGDVLYKRVSEGIADWVMNEMQSPAGGYYASLDADSEGHEGQYYVWDREEIRALLTQQEYAVCAPHYALDSAPNFEGHWHLRVRRSLSDVARAEGLTDAQAETLLHSARAKLLAVRVQRLRPALDDKVLTAWNGLMIAGMASAGRLLDRQDWIDSAKRAAQFIYTRLWHEQHLRASFCAERADLPAYLDDYAFLLDGLLQLLQVRWNAGWFAWIQALADTLLAQFEDPTHGGFWFTAHDQPTPLQRPKTFGDESMPAGNAMAARALLSLGHLCAEPRYIYAAERALKAALPSANRYPDGHLSTFMALCSALQPPTMVILRGQKDRLREWQSELDKKYDTQRVALAIPNDVSGLTGLLAYCAPRGNICAYVCQGTSCSLPITSLAELLKALPP